VPKKIDNVVLTRAAAQALRGEFIGWQCRLRQLAARQDGGRPSSGMRPTAFTVDGDAIVEAFVTLIVESDPAQSTQQFRYQYLKTQDPNERYDKMLEILQGAYFQEPARFSDVMTALFGPESVQAERLLAARRCVLEFEQYTQGYRVPCAVALLAATHPRHEATYWHNRMFNANLPARVQVLSFTPDWPHAGSYRTSPSPEP
jgi:hypothetical protein